MKAKVILSALFAVSMLLAAGEVEAQVATKKEVKQVEKHEKFLNKQIKEKAIKQARKEAKRLEKQGYKVPVGQIPLAKQLENSWQAQYEIDGDGYPYYFTATASTIGSNYTATQMQAVNTAKLDIAGQIQTQVNQFIEAKIANNEISSEDAVSINSFVSASKSVISNSLGRVLKLVEIYRVLDNGNNEVMVTLGYNTDLAMKEAIKAMQKTLDADADKLMDELNLLLEK